MAASGSTDAATRPLASGTLVVCAAWCLLSVGDALHEGEFSPVSLAMLMLAAVALVVVVAARLPLALPDRRVLAVPIGVSVLAAVLLPGGRYMHVPGHGLLVVQVLAAVTAVTAAVTLLLERHLARGVWWLLIGLAAATGITTVVLASDPQIDVWYLLQQSSTGLLHGDDMYRQHWAHSTGLQAVYPYLPATTLLLAPFRWLLGDVRFGLLAAMLLTAFVVRRLAPGAPVALAALVLVQPHMTFLLDQSWTEPLLVLGLAVAVLALRSERPVVAVIALGLTLACKQHIVLLLPLFALWPGFGLRRTAQSVGLAVLVVAPWFVAGPSDLWHDAVHANLSLGVLQRALCLPSLFSRWGVEVGFWFLLLALAGSYALVLRRLPRTPSGLALGSALVMLVVDLANKQSFFNHYQLPLGLLVVAIAAAPVASGGGRAAPSPAADSGVESLRELTA